MTTAETNAFHAPPPHRVSQSDSSGVALWAKALLLAAAVIFTVPSAYAVNFSTFFQENSTIQALGHDAAGNIYVLGLAGNNPIPGYGAELFVAKLNSGATELAYFVYLGGSADDLGTAMAVDSSGNAYITGYTNSPDFPVTAGPSPALTQPSPFLMKLGPAGVLLNSTLFAGQASAEPQALAVDSAGNAYITGISMASGFPVAGGAYSVGDSQNRPFVAKVDPTGSKLLFSAIGIGGSSLVLGPSGDIFVAGNTLSNATYPTTTNAIQTSISFSESCGMSICFPNAEQYVTRLSGNGATLVYSTFLTGSSGAVNSGLAVDSAGNAYVTGTTASPDYPFSVAQRERPGLFLTKIDPTGSKILWSEQQGGNLLALDNSGNLAVAGSFLPLSGPPFAAPGGSYPPFPDTGNVPAQCLPNGVAVQSDAYTQRFSSVDGSLLATRILAATELTVSARSSAMTVNTNGVIVVAGYSYLPDVPLTPGVVFTGAITQRTVPGSYLAGFDFATASPATQVNCVLDAAAMSPVGPVAPGQLLSLAGYGLGPQIGVTGTGTTAIPTALAGVQVTFDGVPAPLLYVSSGQINIQVPFEVSHQASTVMTVSVASSTGASPATATRQFAVTASNPGMFVNSGGFAFGDGLQAIALNSDGSLNSAANPAKAGSSVTVFLNGVDAATGAGLATGAIVAPNPSPLGSQVDVRVGALSLAAGPLYPSAGSIDGVYRLSVQMPTASSAGVTPIGLFVTIDGLAAGPFAMYDALYQTPAIVWIDNQ